MPDSLERSHLPCLLKPTRGRLRQRTLAVALLTGPALLLAGCSGSSSGDSETTGEGPPPINVGGAEPEDTPIPSGNPDSPELAQIQSLDGPVQAALGQIVTFMVTTDFVPAADITDVAVVLPDENIWFKVPVVPEPAAESAAGNYKVELNIGIANAEALANTSFALEFALMNGDGTGGYRSFNLQIADNSVNCPQDAACGARECGPDPICAQTCGSCEASFACTFDGACEPAHMSGDGDGDGDTTGDGDGDTTGDGDGDTTGDGDGDGDGDTTGDGDGDGDCLTCEGEGFNCGTIFDGCGGMLDCGSCTEPDSCGALMPNVCGCDTSWQNETILSSTVAGEALDFDIAPDGTLLVAYNYSPANDIGVASLAPGDVWTTEEVAGTDINFASIQDDGAGGIAVYWSSSSTFSWRPNIALKPDGGIWSTQGSVLNVPAVGSDLLVASDGEVIFPFVHDYNDNHAISAGSSSDGQDPWTLAEADANQSDSYAGKTLSSTITADDTIYVAYGFSADAGLSSGLRVATRNSAGIWSFETAESAVANELMGRHPDIQLDAAGTLHVVHHGTNGLLHSAKPMGGNWSTEVVWPTGNGGENGMFVDAGGTVHVAFSDTAAGSDGVYVISKPAAGSWGTPVLIDDASYGNRLKFEADPSGNLHLVYASDDQTTLRHAWKNSCQ